AADPPAEHRLVLPLDPGDADHVPHPVPLLAHGREHVGVDLLDVAEDVGEAGGRVVAALLVLAEGEPAEAELRLLQPPERRERDVLEEDVGLVGRARDDLVPARPDEGVRHPGQLGDEGEVRGVEVARGDEDGGRRPVVDEELPVPVVDVAAGGADELRLDGVPLRLHLVALAVEQLHLPEAEDEGAEDGEREEGEDAEAEADLLLRRRGGVLHVGGGAASEARRRCRAGAKLYRTGQRGFAGRAGGAPSGAVPSSVPSEPRLSWRVSPAPSRRPSRARGRRPRRAFPRAPRDPVPRRSGVLHGPTRSCITPLRWPPPPAPAPPRASCPSGSPSSSPPSSRRWPPRRPPRSTSAATRSATTTSTSASSRPSTSTST